MYTTTVDSITAAISFIFFVAVLTSSTITDENAVGRDEWWEKRTVKPKVVPRTLTNYSQLIGNSLLFVLSIAHALIIANSKGDGLSMEADPEVTYVLFGSLIWLIYFLLLITDSHGAGIEQQFSWGISLIAYGLTTSYSIASGTKHLLDNIVQAVRVLILIGLVITAILERRLRRRQRANEPKSEETQPLLQETNQEQATTDHTVTQGDDDNNYDDDDAESIFSDMAAKAEEEDDEDDLGKAEKAGRKALRDRSTQQYILSFRLFLPFIRPKNLRQWFYLSISLLNTLINRVISIAMPLMLGAIVSDLAHHELNRWKIIGYVALQFAASSSGTALIETLVTFRLNTEMHNNLVTHCFNHVMDLSADYHMNKSTPSTWQIMSRGDSVISLLQNIFFHILPTMADLVIALFVVGKLFGGYLCFTVAITMILLSWCNRVTMVTKTNMRRDVNDIWENWYCHFTDSLQHWRTVSEFNKIGYEKERHVVKTRHQTEVEVKQRQYRLGLDAVQELVVTAGFLAVCLIAASEIFYGRSDVGRFVVLIAYWDQIMSPVTSLAGSASNISEQLVDAEKLLLLLERQPTIRNITNAPKFEFKGGHVRFENVSFGYDKERQVTKNVSFEALPGETIALVGETGGGKSTIFNLLCRFFDPKEGKIEIDGQDLSKIDLESYRAVLGLVPQNPVLFNTTIAKNVKYSCPTKVSKEDVIAACRAAQFHDKIMKFPKKYKQRVGEWAQKLSGGELQRLAIARAILKKPGILLLDEATSAVDSVTESKIQDALDDLCKSKTTFVIAHRLSTIMAATKILVIKGGEIVESGSHETLLKNEKGAYRELWEAQTKLAKGRKGKKDGQGQGDENDDKSDFSGGVFYDDAVIVVDKNTEDNKIDEDKKTEIVTVTGLETPPRSTSMTPTPTQNDTATRETSWLRTHDIDASDQDTNATKDHGT